MLGQEQAGGLQRGLMIFGFNTDIKASDGKVYHVQSEARAGERLLQTQIFVQGRCIGKRAVSYAEHLDDPEFNEPRLQDMLRNQHRWVIDAIRQGYLDEVLKGASPQASAPVPVETPQPTLNLQFLSSSRPTAAALHLKFRLVAGSEHVTGAEVVGRMAPDSGAAHMFSGGGFARGSTGPDGTVELRMPLDGNTPGEASLTVQVAHQGARACFRFRLKTSG